MSRMYANAGILLTSIFGVLTAYTAFKPEFERQREEREGTFTVDHAEAQKANEHVLSEAIAQDFKEANEELKKSGIGWGYRALWNGESVIKDKKKKSEMQPMTSDKIDGTKETQAKNG